MLTARAKRMLFFVALTRIEPASPRGLPAFRLQLDEDAMRDHFVPRLWPSLNCVSSYAMARDSTIGRTAIIGIK
jgi:hypothetical protein